MSILLRRRLLGDDPMVGVIPVPTVLPPSENLLAPLSLAEDFVLSEPPNYLGIDVGEDPAQLTLAVDFGDPVAP